MGKKKAKQRKCKPNLNDLVKIRTDSEYYGQSDIWGKVDKVYPFDGLPYKVRFADGYCNSYSDKDLDLLQKGDNIMINENGTIYRCSRPGSEGTIVGFVEDGCLEVKFHKLTGEGRAPDTFSNILAAHVSLLKDVKETEQKRKEEAEKSQRGKLSEVYTALCGWNY